jgi:hypothetical protein
VDFLWLDVDVVVLVLGDVWEEARGLVFDWGGNEWGWLVEVNLGWSSVVEVVAPVSGCWLPDWLLNDVGVTSVVLVTSDIVVLEVLSVVLDVVLVINLLVDGIVVMDLVVGRLSNVCLSWLGKGWVVVGLSNVDGAGYSSEAESGSE